MAKRRTPRERDELWCRTACNSMPKFPRDVKVAVGKQSCSVVIGNDEMIWEGEFYAHWSKWEDRTRPVRLDPENAARLRRYHEAAFRAAFRAAVPEWAAMSVGDLWLADARSLVGWRALTRRDRILLRDDPKIGDVVTVARRRVEIVSGADWATHSYAGDFDRIDRTSQTGQNAATTVTMAARTT